MRFGRAVRVSLTSLQQWLAKREDKRPVCLPALFKTRLERTVLLDWCTEGGIRAMSFTDVRGCPSYGFWSVFAFIHVRGCSLPVADVPVEIPGSADARAGRKRCGSSLSSVPAVFTRMVVWLRQRHHGGLSRDAQHRKRGSRVLANSWTGPGLHL